MNFSNLFSWSSSGSSSKPSSSTINASFNLSYSSCSLRSFSSRILCSSSSCFFSCSCSIYRDQDMFSQIFKLKFFSPLFLSWKRKEFFYWSRKAYLFLRFEYLRKSKQRCKTYNLFVTSKKRNHEFSNWAAKQQTSWVIALWWFSVSPWRLCITFVWPSGSLKLPAPSSWSECHLHFASIRMCLAMLLIMSISQFKMLQNVFKMKKQGLKCFLNTLLKRGFKRLSGLYAAI
jgi:hypothetical protein